MPENYVYKLWNGKEVVGLANTLGPLQGKSFIVFEVSTFKQRYGVLPKTSEFLLIDVKTSYNTYETMIDIRRKSKRQLALLRNI